MARLLPVVLVLLALAGCDFTKFTVNTTADVFEQATPGIEEHWDYQLAADALPAQVMQLEGLIEISPENESLLLQGARAYASYGFGFVEDEAERLDAAGDSEAAAVEKERAIAMYLRARNLAHRYLTIRDDDFPAYHQGDLATYEAWLRDEFDDPEDAPALWWTGYAWGLFINARYPTERRRDRAYAIALVRRSVALDPTYYGSSGLALLAFVATQRPNANLDEARAAWDRALESSGRSNLLILVTMARVYAVKRQDRELFTSLLREVLAAGDVDPDLRLSNKVARRRAERYLSQVDTIFQPAAPAAPSQEDEWRRDPPGR